jgi:hypothetical protein
LEAKEQSQIDLRTESERLKKKMEAIIGKLEEENKALKLVIATDTFKTFDELQESKKQLRRVQISKEAYANTARALSEELRQKDIALKASNEVCSSVEKVYKYECFRLERDLRNANEAAEKSKNHVANLEEAIRKLSAENEWHFDRRTMYRRHFEEAPGLHCKIYNLESLRDRNQEELEELRTENSALRSDINRLMHLLDSAKDVTSAQNDAVENLKRELAEKDILIRELEDSGLSLQAGVIPLSALNCVRNMSLEAQVLILELVSSGKLIIIDNEIAQ